MKPVIAEVQVFVARPPEQVFAYFADLRHEPEYNSQVSDIRKTTEGPLRRGTTFEGLHKGLGVVSWTLVEYSPPRRVAIEGRVGSGTYRWVSDLEPSGEHGTTMHGRMEWRPTNALRFLAPVLGPILKFSARRTFARFANSPGMRPR